ncbi:acyl carrier protein [Streptomyces sp. NPDC005728]|uniref:acyl carrier protein n=1 Tax=Streptomyces sp. NPDC005728 TaxID=3157054 RepID=UPI0033C6D1D1
MNDQVLEEGVSKELLFTDFRAILVECAGDEEDTQLTEAVLDVPFTDLGYDSLAVLETAAAVGQRYDVVLRDEDVAEAVTPRAFLLLVNHALSTAA